MKYYFLDKVKKLLDSDKIKYLTDENRDDFPEDANELKHFGNTPISIIYWFKPYKSSTGPYLPKIEQKVIQHHVSIAKIDKDMKHPRFCYLFHVNKKDIYYLSELSKLIFEDKVERNYLIKLVNE